MDSLFVVMPAYNEEENIEAVIKQWYPVLKGKDSRLVIADSGSSDHTHDIIERLKEEYPCIECLSDTERQHGPKVIALYDHAIKQGADYIFQTDSDGQTNPEEFDEFWELRKEYDCIIGNRCSREDGKQRIFVEKMVCCLLKIFFHVTIPDANAPFRLMKTETVKKYLYELKADYIIPNIMLTTYFVYFKENVMFKEISFKSRQGGENSINFFKIIKIGWESLFEFNEFRKRMKKRL